MSASIDWGGARRQPCPACSRSPKDRTCGVTIDQGGSGVAHCFRCGYVETLREEQATKRPGSRQARPSASLRYETLSTHGRELWATCKPLCGTVGADYLLHRGCRLPPGDGDLRFHPALAHPPSGHVGPALVALVTHAQTGVPLTLHRTWITPTGKADVSPPRMLLGGHSKRNGVIRLWFDEFVNKGLLVGEGVESVLAAAQHYAPAWACVDAQGLESLPVLNGIECLIVAADHDARGIEAASRCADRWARAGRDVRVIAPRRAGADWADARRAG